MQIQFFLDLQKRSWLIYNVCYLLLLISRQNTCCLAQYSVQNTTALYYSCRFVYVYVSDDEILQILSTFPS